MKAMILAAGLGTRLKPFTDYQPKALFKIENRTLLEWTIRYLKKFGVDELIINVHHYPDQIIDYLKQNNGFGLPYTISDERTMLMDTGGAIVKASKYLSGRNPFILIGIDVLTDLNLSDMLQFHISKKPLVTLAVKERITTRSLLFNKNMCLAGWRDNNSGEIKGNTSEKYSYALGFSTIHIINPEIFKFITERGAFSIIDLYLSLISRHTILGYRHDSSAWFEFGRIEMIDQILRNLEFKRLISTY